MVFTSSPMKRPAAVLRAEPSGNGRTRKSVLNAKKVVTLVGKLKAVKGISDELRRDIASRQKQLVRGSKLRVDHAEAAHTLAELARLVENELQATLNAAHAKIKRAEYDKEALTAAQAVAESDLAKFKQAVVDQKVAVRHAERAIEDNRQRIKAETAAHKSVEVQAKGIESKKIQLEAIAEKAYAPLKETAASGSDGRKRINALRKIGKQYGFHKEMLGVMPVILKKKIDKRQTFDGLVLKSLDDEFTKHISSMRAKLEEGKTSLAEHNLAAHQAREALTLAEQTKERSAQAASEAEEAVAKSREAIVEARRRVKAFPAEVGRTLRDLTAAKARLDKFRGGTLATLQKCLTAADPPVPMETDFDCIPASPQ